MIAEQQSLHEQFSKELHQEGDKLIQEFRQRYSTAVTQELSSFSKTAVGLEEDLQNQTNSYISDLLMMKNELENDRKRMFTFTKPKGFLFWLGCMTNFGTFIFLLLEYYIKGF